MKIILFALLDQWADWEAAYLSSAIRMLGQNEYAGKTVSLTSHYVESIGGLQVLPDYDMQSVPAEYEALILIGGMSWRGESARQVKPLVDKCLKDGKALGGICDVAGFLAANGVLDSVRHTGNGLADLKSWAGGAYAGEENYIEEQAVADNNIITANGTAALEFAREVLLRLKVAPEEKIIEWYNFHKQGYCQAPVPKAARAWQSTALPRKA